MTEFLSGESIASHKEYVKQLSLKYSIIESSVPHLRGAKVKDLFRIPLTRRDREDALLLLPEILLHERYFMSFAEVKQPRSDAVSAIYGSEASFLNKLYKLAGNFTHGFLTIYENARAEVVFDYRRAFRYGEPLLAVDLCEHAYFLDYGFDRERYLLLCLQYLDLTKITI